MRNPFSKKPEPKEPPKVTKTTEKSYLGSYYTYRVKLVANNSVIEGQKEIASSFSPDVINPSILIQSYDRKPFIKLEENKYVSLEGVTQIEIIPVKKVERYQVYEITSSEKPRLYQRKKLSEETEEYPYNQPTEK